MFGLIGAYLLGRSDGRRSAHRRGQALDYFDRTPAEIKLLRGVALVIICCAIAVAITYL